MSNEYGFFASKDHDRRYSADDFSAFFNDFFTNGVLGSDTNSLMVSAVGDMNISIAAGTAYINGHWYRKSSAQVLSLGDSDTVYGRTDAVVIRCDLEKRMVYPFIIEGVPEETPAQPLPVRNEKCYDLVLAYVDVAANCVEVTAADITDKRGFDDVCGFVTGAVDHIDTAGLFKQYEAQWELLKAACSNDSAAVIKAWSELIAVKKINGIVPTDGEVKLTQSLIPSDSEVYQMPYYIQSGIITVGESSWRGVDVTFPMEFADTPILMLTPSLNFRNKNDLYPILVGYGDLTKSGFKISSRAVESSSSIGTSNYYGTVQWIALGKI